MKKNLLILLFFVATANAQSLADSDNTSLFNQIINNTPSCKELENVAHSSGLGFINIAIDKDNETLVYSRYGIKPGYMSAFTEDRYWKFKMTQGLILNFQEDKGYFVKDDPSFNWVMLLPQYDIVDEGLFDFEDLEFASQILLGETPEKEELDEKHKLFRRFYRAILVSKKNSEDITGNKPRNLNILNCAEALLSSFSNL